ncbi:MAG: hypothetical protein JW860_08285 [Sedimentisphaerales bacterium]|nr:hypothetical protein [Sedimentisphaerales bacterium]
MTRLRTFIIICIFLFFALLGVRMCLCGDEFTLTDVLLHMTIQFSVVMACMIDARLIGKRLYHIVPFVMLFTWPITVPIYLIWTRKHKGLLLTLGFITGLLLTVNVAVIATWYVFYAINP